ncbi:Hypothetical predicted protein [Scomber scombrus]|uniref:Uncharacterized protein n=1 Tax=Scomber scombrus TaxID=13677 RepID=A0AAV1Q3Y0_SCOSC
MEEKIGMLQRRGGLFSTFCFPARHHGLVQRDAAEAVIDWKGTDRMDFVTDGTLHSGCRLCLLVRLTCESRGTNTTVDDNNNSSNNNMRDPTSCSNPPQILSGLVNRNNGIASSMPTACGPRKIARVVTHDYRS